MPEGPYVEVLSAWDFPLYYHFASGKKPDCQCRKQSDEGSIPGTGRSSGGGHGNPFQDSCLENPRDRRACWATVHGVTKSRTWLKWLSRYTLFCSLYFIPSKKMKSLSRVRLFSTPWTVAHQVPPSMEFSRQEYWSGLTFPSSGDLPDAGIEPGSPALQADALLSEPPGKLRV